jgi:hypothetical protein
MPYPNSPPPKRSFVAFSPNPKLPTSLVLERRRLHHRHLRESITAPKSPRAARPPLDLPPGPYAATWANVGACVPFVRAAPAPNCAPAGWAGWAGRLGRRPAARRSLPGGWGGLPCAPGPGPAGWAGWRLRPRCPPAVPRFPVPCAPLAPLSPPMNAAQGGRDHAPVPRSRTSSVSSPDTSCDSQYL